MRGASLGAVVFAVNTALVALGQLRPVNTALVALGQLPALRWAQRRSAARVTAFGGALFVVSFVAYASLALVEVPMEAVCVGLALVTGLYMVGELLHSAGTTTLTHDAAPAHARGRYLAFFQLSWASAAVLGPVLFGWLVGHGAAGLWLPLAGLTAIAAAGLTRLRLSPAEPAAEDPAPPGPGSGGRLQPASADPDELFWQGHRLPPASAMLPVQRHAGAEGKAQQEGSTWTA